MVFTSMSLVPARAAFEEAEASYQLKLSSRCTGCPGWSLLVPSELPGKPQNPQEKDNVRVGRKTDKRLQLVSGRAWNRCADRRIVCAESGQGNARGPGDGCARRQGVSAPAFAGSGGPD